MVFLKVLVVVFIVWLVASEHHHPNLLNQHPGHPKYTHHTKTMNKTEQTSIAVGRPGTPLDIV